MKCGGNSTNSVYRTEVTTFSVLEDPGYCVDDKDQSLEDLTNEGEMSMETC